MSEGPRRRRTDWWNDTRALYPDMALPDLPAIVEAAVERMSERTKRRASKGARGTTDKSGQGTRNRIRRQILALWGPYCHLCVLWGTGLERARIDLELKPPHPEAFSRDHVKPRALGGAIYAAANQRPAFGAGHVLVNFTVNIVIEYATGGDD